MPAVPGGIKITQAVLPEMVPEARKIETVLQEKDFKSVTRSEIISLIQKYQTLAKTRSLAESFAREAQEALRLFAPSAYWDALHSIPRIILEREK